MTYRSSVMAVVYGVHHPFGVSKELLTIDKETRYPLLKTLMGTTFKEIADMWGSHFRWRNSDGVLLFKADSIKWYHNDKDIRDFDTFLREAKNLGFESEFVRVGENRADIEERVTINALGLLTAEVKIVVNL